MAVPLRNKWVDISGNTFKHKFENLFLKGSINI